jgi:hypothetical protein
MQVVHCTVEWLLSDWPRLLKQMQNIDAIECVRKCTIVPWLSGMNSEAVFLKFWQSRTTS